ncbi:MAG: nickel pincer cofactor biosynthesis protein LarC [Fretibacterium sp.]|nr:nickel pincer cofactor biosynthesis protein LarC [Fretibacterium sp.]
MRTIYLDCFAGIAGDMLVGALLNFLPPLGSRVHPSPDVLREGLLKLTALNPEEYELVAEPGVKNGIAGINFDVRLPHHEDHHHEGHGHEHHHEEHGDHHHPHRHLQDIEAMISASTLPVRVKRESLRAFSLLADAEASVHGTTPDQVHFHEVGAVDSIIDIVGTFILMEALGWPRVLCSPINVGSGTVTCAHGVLPVPAPAAAFLLHGLPVFSRGEPMERTTPTGALLVKMLADGFCSVPPGRIVASGFGLGNHTSADMPNVLRALLMDTDSEEGDGLIHEKLALLECNIDDMNPQDFEPVTEHLFKAGALDVWTEPIYMKKGRPAVRFCCLTEPDRAKDLTVMMLKETTSQGVRVLEAARSRLRWHSDRVETSLGELSVKSAFLGDELLRRTPEYEGLKRLAGQHGLPITEVRARVAGELAASPAPKTSCL